MYTKQRFFPGIIFMLFCLIFLFYSCGNEQPKQTKKERPLENGIILFDGANMNAWRGFKQEALPAGWKVQDSLLITSGEGGDLGGDIISKEQFEDFKLSLEWKISEGGNSGIFFHVIEGDNPTVYVSGPEYQLIDDEGFSYPLENWQKAAANYAMHNTDSIRKKLHPAGEWNYSGIRVRDGHVTHWLNGEKVLEYDLWDDDWKNRLAASKWKDYPAYGLALRGHIGLQDHGSKVAFRNIKIKDLTDKGKPLFNGKDLSGWKIYGSEKWYVDKGELVCESGEEKKYGYLGTEKNYKDFVLRLKFFQESDGNSGVFFRSSIEGTKISGWQVEVAPPGNNTGGIYESYGRGWLNEIPEEKENILREGEWNDLVIRVEGERVMTWLNGQLMTDLQDEKIGQANGSIALQIHDGGGIKLRWKEIFIREINVDNDEIQ
ncbi:MAG: DUF1080 domain-containing protein [Bacteroidetes bacterium]|nr:DUF1080 domain-containing protein [Bacteroidota bacterium]